MDRDINEPRSGGHSPWGEIRGGGAAVAGAGGCGGL
jgi:hypothetical protein